jgi:hypothetical protein
MKKQPAAQRRSGQPASSQPPPAAAANATRRPAGRSPPRRTPEAADFLLFVGDNNTMAAAWTYYRCVKRSQIRGGAPLDSPKCGILEVGCTVQALDSLRLQGGTTRVKFSSWMGADGSSISVSGASGEGWVSLKTRSGVTVLERVATPQSHVKAGGGRVAKCGRVRVPSAFGGPASSCRSAPAAARATGPTTSGAPRGHRLRLPSAFTSDERGKVWAPSPAELGHSHNARHKAAHERKTEQVVAAHAVASVPEGDPTGVTGTSAAATMVPSTLHIRHAPHQQQRLREAVAAGRQRWALAARQQQAQPSSSPLGQPAVDSFLLQASGELQELFHALDLEGDSQIDVEGAEGRYCTIPFTSVCMPMAHDRAPGWLR